MEEACAEITDEQVEMICELHRQGLPWGGTGSISLAMKRLYGEGPTGWGWHWALLIMAHAKLH